MQMMSEISAAAARAISHNFSNKIERDQRDIEKVGNGDKRESAFLVFFLCKCLMLTQNVTRKAHICSSSARTTLLWYPWKWVMWNRKVRAYTSSMSSLSDTINYARTTPWLARAEKKCRLQCNRKKNDTRADRSDSPSGFTCGVCTVCVCLQMAKPTRLVGLTSLSPPILGGERDRSSTEKLDYIWHHINLSLDASKWTTDEKQRRIYKKKHLSPTSSKSCSIELID